MLALQRLKDNMTQAQRDELEAKLEAKRQRRVGFGRLTQIARDHNGDFRPLTEPVHKRIKPSSN